MAQALAEIHYRKLWKAAGHATWKEYLEQVPDIDDGYSYRLINAVKFVRVLKTLPIGSVPIPLPSSESQVRPLLCLPDDDSRVAAWSAASAACADGTLPTARQVKQEVDKMRGNRHAAKPAPKPGSIPADHPVLVGLKNAFLSGNQEEVTRWKDAFLALMTTGNLTPSSPTEGTPQKSA